MPVLGAVCLFCRRIHLSPSPPGWEPFVDGALRCPRCVVGAVHTQHDARRHLPVIRRQLTELGLSLPERVLVRMIGPDAATAGGGLSGGGVVLGFTEQVIRGAERPRVTGINIVAGMPPIYFGRAVAHEFGHAWLALHGQVPVDDVVEEGLCELFAYAWLKRHGTPTAELLRRQVRTNADPMYGGGFRTVYGVVRQDGITAVLDRLLRTGRLYDG